VIRHPLISDPTPEDLDAIAPESTEHCYDAPFSAAELRELRRAAALDKAEPPAGGGRGMKRYLVIEKIPCPRCKGEGFVYNAWFWDEYDEARQSPGAGGVDPDDFARFVMGLDEAPPVEEECTVCGGTGVVRREVPLEEALKALKGVSHA